jgi:exodeoxyribonuclease-5
MKLTKEQSDAVDAIASWRDDPSEREFLLAGYAGTGKTTLLQHFINGRPNPTLCLTPTGKAASILQKKLKDAAVSTIHSALYVPVTSPRTRLKRLESELLRHPADENLQLAVKRERERLLRNNLKFSPKIDHKIVSGQLVVVDEASMVTRAMRNDLLATGAKILYVGDPGQLPPVMDAGFFQITRPNAMLEEIQRQAFDSPIIRLSLAVRQGERLEEVDEPGCCRRSKQDMPARDWLKYDQVLTGSNNARRGLNRYFRKLLGHEGWLPRKGEKLICLKNYRDDETTLVNGGLASSTSDFFGHDDLRTVWGDVDSDGEELPGTQCDAYPFKAHYEADLLPEEFDQEEVVQHFDYGYAITVHKSQGSEWNKVVLADDGMRRRDAEFRRRWLYTAVTRAKRELLWLF